MSAACEGGIAYILEQEYGIALPKDCIRGFLLCQIWSWFNPFFNIFQTYPGSEAAHL